MLLIYFICLSRTKELLCRASSRFDKYTRFNIFISKNKQKMMSQRNKQNSHMTGGEGIKTGGNMLYKAIEVLKQDKQALVRQNEQRQKYHQQQKKKLKIEIDGYKKKIAQLTQANILNSLIKKQPTGFIPGKLETQQVSRIKKLELQVQHYKKIIEQREKTIQGNKKQCKQLQKRVRLLQEQKQKHLQISLTQKINLQQKVELFQRQLASKKKIIEGLKLEIQKTNKLEFELAKKQRQIIKRGRDMNRYQTQFQSYFLENQNKFKRKVQNLEQENLFLKKQIKKIVKKVKNTCQCEGQMEEWKQKLYEVGKQLAKARVELGRNDITKDRNSIVKRNVKQVGKKKYQSDLIENQNEGINSNINPKYHDSCDSIESLTLSEQSSLDEKQQNWKKTQKKK